MVWDRLSTHISKTMKALVAERDWLTVVLLPGYAPDRNPVEGLWAHIKRSLANLAARTLSELKTLLRRRLKVLQYRHSILGGFLAGTGLALDRPDGPYTPKSVSIVPHPYPGSCQYAKNPCPVFRPTCPASIMRRSSAGGA